MANLSAAPSAQVDKAKAAYKAFKAYAKKHGIGYVRVYNSYNPTTKMVRTKVYAVNGATTHRDELAKMGFAIILPWHGMGGSLSLAGNF